MRSVCEIAIVACPTNLPPSDVLEALFLQLEFGIPRRALPLLTLRAGLSRSEYLTLVELGLMEPDTLWPLSDEELKLRVPPALLQKLQVVRPVKEKIRTAGAHEIDYGNILS
jgi:hypothetical protein